MVECQLPKLDVAGSTPVSRSIQVVHGSLFTVRGLEGEEWYLSVNHEPSTVNCREAMPSKKF